MLKCNEFNYESDLEVCSVTAILRPDNSANHLTAHIRCPGRERSLLRCAKIVKKNLPTHMIAHMVSNTNWHGILRALLITTRMLGVLIVAAIRVILSLSIQSELRSCL